MKTKFLLFIFISAICLPVLRAQQTKCISEPDHTNISSKSLLMIEPNVTEDFESYSDFAIQFSPWILLDVDETPTYGITDVSFPNSGSAMSYIIFNRNSTSPPLGDDDGLAAHSGEKFAACFSSIPSQGTTNNDWMITPAMALGVNSELTFYGKSYTTEYGAEKLKVLVSTTGTNPSDFTEISDGIIELPEAWNEYVFDLSEYDGQEVYIAFQCLSEDAFILMLDDILVSTEESINSTLTGMVTDALNGEPVEGALVEVAGLSDYTDAGGNYTIENVPEGSLTANFLGNPTSGSSPLTVAFTDLSTINTQLVTCSSEGYTTYSNNQVQIPANSTVELDISLSPTLSGGEMRFVLNWGADPRDLDSHVRTPLIEGSNYHIYYSSVGSATSPPYVTLDHDDTNGYGPETITLYQFSEGTYHYYIYKYAGDGELIDSEAVVQVYSESGLVQTLQVPTSGTGRYWYVATIDGATHSINYVNTIQEAEPGTGKLNVEYPEKPISEDVNRDGITSWEWNFGDGNTSTAQNPSHTFQTNGDYDVTLTVSDGTNESTITKEGYVSVQNTNVEIVSVSPNEATQGESLTLSITGSNTSFAQGSNIVWFSQGSNVIYPEYVSALDNETIEAEFIFSHSDEVGLYDVHVSNGVDGELIKQGLFTLNEDLSGVDDFIESQIAVYPNPFTNQIKVEFGDAIVSSVRIFDMRGKRIVEKVNPTSDEVISLSNIRPGVYCLNIIINDKSYIRKIIKR